MRKLILLLCFSICQMAEAQHKTAFIKLETTQQQISLPFYINQIVFASDVSDSIGIISTQKNKWNTYATFENKEQIMQEFLGKQFDQSKSGSAFTLIISELKIAPVNQNRFDSKDTFLFKCAFQRFGSSDTQTLYTFTAASLFGHAPDAPKVLSYYIAQSLIAATEKFKEAYDENDGWKQKEEIIPALKPVLITVLLNHFSGDDSIACTKDRKLTWDDFQNYSNIQKARKTNIADSGAARFILIYKVNAQENDERLTLEINVKAFLHKGNSWKPKIAGNDQWLQYQQGHFDICALFGYRFFETIKKYTFSLGEYRSELNRIYNDLYTEYTATSAQYESDTERGRNELQMNKWQAHIREMMQSADK